MSVWLTEPTGGLYLGLKTEFKCVKVHNNETGRLFFSCCDLSILENSTKPVVQSTSSQDSSLLSIHLCCDAPGALLLWKWCCWKGIYCTFFFFFLFIYSFPAHFDSLVHAVQTGLISGQKDPLFYMSIEHFSIVELILC